VGDKRTYYMSSRGAPRPTRDTDTHSVTEGVASSGEESKQGTVTHIHHRNGRIDATIRPKPVSIKLSQEL
jgi:hypothetical protein